MIIHLALCRSWTALGRGAKESCNASVLKHPSYNGVGFRICLLCPHHSWTARPLLVRPAISPYLTRNSA
jgi:hypothetical protein